MCNEHLEIGDNLVKKLFTGKKVQYPIAIPLLIARVNINFPHI